MVATLHGTFCFIVEKPVDVDKELIRSHEDALHHLGFQLLPVD
jgi:predicted nuclease with RNAse H fold